MARKTIPYESLQKALNDKYPWPVHRNVFLLKKGEPDGKTPVRVYDRSTGNFAPIGYSVTVTMLRFNGKYAAAMNPQYDDLTFDDIILTDE